MILSLLLQGALASPAAAPTREVRLVMGTTAEVRAAGAPEPQQALEAAFQALDDVDRRMSLWHSSELTELNEAGQATLSPPVLAVLLKAIEMAEASGGAFDPTVEPLVRARGGLGDPPRRPSREARRRLLAKVDWHHIHLKSGSTVRLEKGARLDFGGIAKGYAADLALDALRRAGAVSGLVDLGQSSIGVFGPEPLSLVVRDPHRPQARPWATFQVQDRQVATSGGDQKPGHIIDPHTGLAARKVLAATALASTGIEADALSTAVFVLGAREGLALLERRQAEGFVLLGVGSRRILRTTPGFAAAHELKPAHGVEVVP